MNQILDRDIAAGRRAIEAEAQALTDLAATLDQSFSRAVEILEKVTGRVILSGMGKSGHVARKIAATMASVGTPSQFVHPGEASHGDLGMITRADAVICLSNSGETSELSDIIAYARRFQVPLIGMVGRGENTLSENADVALVCPPAVEACPMGLAPTTSTTMMLALGDALAIALLERKGFSPDEFRIFHPGGRLGQQLLRVRQVMHTGDAMPLCPAGTRMDQALLEISSKSFGCVGIVDAQGKLIGVVTDGDLRRHMGAGFLELKVDDVMTTDPQVIDLDALSTEAVAVMNNVKITSLFVTDDGRPTGIVHLHDCLRVGAA